MHPSALIPHREAWFAAQRLLEASRVVAEGADVTEQIDGSTRIRPVPAASSTALRGFRVSRESSSVILVGPGWVHWSRFSWFFRGGRLTIFQRAGMNGQVRLALPTTATSINALEFVYPVDVSLRPSGEELEFYTGPGSPEADPGTVEGVEYKWYFYLATILNGNPTSAGNYPFIEEDPRPFRG